MNKIIKIVVSLGIVAIAVGIVLSREDVQLALSMTGKDDTLENPQEFIEEVREGMLNREETVEVNFKGDSADAHKFVGEAIDKAFEIDKADTTSDGDYLRHCYKGTKIEIKGVANTYKVKYEFDYLETLQQTQAVDKKVKKVMDQLNIEGKSDYEKIKAIHDYIVTNATYDVTEKRNSAYDNLIRQTSVCQGYATATYKLMMEAGIDCRIITGTGKGESHAWNIVKLDGKWYNIDCTWDDPLAEDNSVYLMYDYFLKSDIDFADHVRDEQYNTIEFNKQYKMADKSY